MQWVKVSLITSSSQIQQEKRNCSNQVWIKDDKIFLNFQCKNVVDQSKNPFDMYTMNLTWILICVTLAVIACNKRLWSPITKKIFIRWASNHQDEEINSYWDMHKTKHTRFSSGIMNKETIKLHTYLAKEPWRSAATELKIRVAQVFHSRWKVDVRSTAFNALKLPTCNTLTKCVCWFLKEKLLTAFCFLVLLNVFCYLKRNSLQPFSAFSGATLRCLGSNYRFVFHSRESSSGKNSWN